MRKKKLGCVAAIVFTVAIVSILLWRIFLYVGQGAWQGIQDGPNTLLCLVEYEDRSLPQIATANFQIVTLIPDIPIPFSASHAVSENHKIQADIGGKISLVWKTNWNVVLEHVSADGINFDYDLGSQYSGSQMWLGYTLGLTNYRVKNPITADGRTTTAVAIHHLAYITLNRATKKFTITHVREAAHP